jgi:hypothetical protein
MTNKKHNIPYKSRSSGKQAKKTRKWYSYHKNRLYLQPKLVLAVPLLPYYHEHKLTSDHQENRLNKRKHLIKKAMNIKIII